MPRRRRWMTRESGIVFVATSKEAEYLPKNADFTS